MRKIVVTAVVILLNGCGPSSYEDCILEHMPKAAGRTAEWEVRDACRAKFPKKRAPQPKLRELSSHELSNLTGGAGQASYGADVSGHIYNGNSSLSVRRLKIRVTHTTGEEKNSHLYEVGVLARPLNRGDFNFQITPGDADSKFSWGIVSAQGHVD